MLYFNVMSNKRHRPHPLAAVMPYGAHAKKMIDNTYCYRTHICILVRERRHICILVRERSASKVHKVAQTLVMQCYLGISFAEVYFCLSCSYLVKFFSFATMYFAYAAADTSYLTFSCFRNASRNSLSLYGIAAFRNVS